MTQDSSASRKPSEPPFRVAFVPGVTPGKWVRAWQQRVPETPLELVPVDEADQRRVLDDGRADMCFVRLPVERSGLSLIPLYREVPVVVVPKEHVVAAFDEVDVSDLAEEYLLQPSDTVPEWRAVATAVRDGSRVEPPAMTMAQAVATVAAGTGIVVVPMSVARLHHRRDLTYRPVTGVAESQVGLAWLETATDNGVDRFVGIVRGRTERSSRDAPAEPSPPPKRSAARPVPRRSSSRAGARGRPRRGGRNPRR